MNELELLARGVSNLCIAEIVNAAAIACIAVIVIADGAATRRRIAALDRARRQPDGSRAGNEHDELSKRMHALQSMRFGAQMMDVIRQQQQR